MISNRMATAKPADVVDPGIHHGMGRSDSVDPLEDREPRAEAEDQDGDDEGPEIELQPVAEGMLGRGGARRAAEAMEKKKLVAGIHGGVDRLAHHGGTAGEGGRGEFGHGDRRIAREGRVDDDFRGDVRHMARISIGGAHGSDGGGDGRRCRGQRRPDEIVKAKRLWPLRFWRLAACGPAGALGKMIANRHGGRP